MKTTYKIVQHVESVKRGWHETIFTGEIERIAKAEFECLKKDHPDEYFELIKIERRETCLGWT